MSCQLNPQEQILREIWIKKKWLKKINLKMPSAVWILSIFFGLNVSKPTDGYSGPLVFVQTLWNLLGLGPQPVK